LSLDTKESFGWSYSPGYDPLYENRAFDPDTVAAYSQDEPHIWLSAAHLDGFKADTLAYWRACLALARKLLPIFALSLELPEDYFASVTTFPGADGVYNFYPVLNEGLTRPSLPDVGIGSHTDLQCFTLLWQDMHGGLQVLNQKSEWIWATPIEDTFVVNIGDFLSRLTNDRYRSTVHRAYNRELCNEERISMPFFFGKPY
jgi:isopenicillin N synthase-like dioxygenase